MIILVSREGDDEIINGSPFFVCKSTPNSFITYSDNIDLSYLFDQLLLNQTHIYYSNLWKVIKSKFMLILC